MDFDGPYSFSKKQLLDCLKAVSGNINAIDLMQEFEQLNNIYGDYYSVKVILPPNAA